MKSSVRQSPRHLNDKVFNNLYCAYKLITIVRLYAIPLVKHITYTVCICTYICIYVCCYVYYYINTLQQDSGVMKFYSLNVKMLPFLTKNSSNRDGMILWCIDVSQFIAFQYTHIDTAKWSSIYQCITVYWSINCFSQWIKLENDKSCENNLVQHGFIPT